MKSATTFATSSGSCPPSVVVHTFSTYGIFVEDAVRVALDPQ
jgi:hypothetical protein